MVMQHAAVVGTILGGTPVRIFEPDLLLGVQWAALHGQVREYRPEERLMIAVLQSAQRDFEHGDLARPPVADWLASEDTAWPLSFLNICSALDLSPSAVRRTFVPRATPRRMARQLRMRG